MTSTALAYICSRYTPDERETTYRVTAPDADTAVDLARTHHPGTITGTRTHRPAPGLYVVTVTTYGPNYPEPPRHPA